MKIYIIISLLVFSSCLSPQKEETAIIIDFPDSLSVFAPGIISTGHKERDLAISPDGNKILYTKTTTDNSFSAIMEMIKSEKGWTSPKIASFSGAYSDLEPAFSPDGKWLYFASRRPINKEDKKDFDIWKVGVSGDGWNKPVRLDTLINTAADEFYPSLSKSGNLYFTASFNFDVSKEDIYVARWNENHFEKPIALPETVNSETYDFNAFVDPDEEFIIFSSSRRKGSRGGDLFLSQKDDQGSWLAAKILDINSETLDYCPFVSADKKHFFFSSRRSKGLTKYPDNISTEDFFNLLESPHNGNGDIWIIPFNEIIPEQ